MKLGVFFIFATNSVEGQRTGNRAVEEKKVDEIDYNAGNWLDVEEWEDLEDEEDDELEDEPADEISPTIQIQADNWLDAEFPEEDSSYVEEDDELSDESDITSHNWLNFNQINEDSTAEYIWHGEKEVASYSACCGDALSSPHSDTHPILAKILPKTNNKLIMERTPDKLFDGSYWTTWKSYQPGNPQYSVTVEFQENIVFRELRLVPDPIPFGTWWYNKELRGLCVYVDDMEVDCTPDNFSLPLEPEEWNYQKNDQTSPEYHRDHAQWESFRDDFFLSFKTSIPDGIVGKTITLKTAVGAEASYGDLKILFDKTSESKFSGKYSKFHTKFEESRTL